MFSILGLITGLAGPISLITGKIADLQTAKLTATTDYQRNQINQQIEEAHDRKAILVAEAGNRLAAGLNASTRLLAALGPILFVFKVFFWDKVIGSFVGCSGPGEH